MIFPFDDVRKADNMRLLRFQYVCIIKFESINLEPTNIFSWVDRIHIVAVLIRLTVYSLYKIRQQKQSCKVFPESYTWSVNRLLNFADKLCSVVFSGRLSKRYFVKSPGPDSLSGRFGLCLLYTFHRIGDISNSFNEIHLTTAIKYQFEYFSTKLQ